jgi:hypothetical protein
VSTVTFMQFSDIHKNVSALDSSEALVSSIRSDMTRYSKEDPCILHPEILIVCGDIVQGSETSTEEIERQYVEANSFFLQPEDALVEDTAYIFQSVQAK